MGAYSEYSFAEEKICFKVPKSLSNEEATTVPLACATAWLALYSEGCLNIQRHAEDKTPILIWGGSCAIFHSRNSRTTLTNCRSKCRLVCDSACAFILYSSGGYLQPKAFQTLQ